MKKLTIICIFILLCFVQPSIANTYNSSAEISKIENSIYGFDYSKENVQTRIERLEKNIYGKSSTGNTDNRLKRIIKDISADEIGLEITPTEDTYLAYEEEKADSSVKYPVVEDIENRLFGKTYNNRDFHTRIVTIERKLFGKIYDVDDYSVRMERIKEKIYPNNSIAQNKNANNNDTVNIYHDKNFHNSLNNQNENIYTYQNINQNPMQRDELSQLEYETFGTEFTGDDTQTRLKRLNSVQKAKKTSRKYDSQKFQQRFATAMEIGAMLLMILAMVL